jgi:hypothetical protein
MHDHRPLVSIKTYDLSGSVANRRTAGVGDDGSIPGRESFTKPFMVDKLAQRAQAILNTPV